MLVLLWLIWRASRPGGAFLGGPPGPGEQTTLLLTGQCNFWNCVWKGYCKCTFPYASTTGPAGIQFLLPARFDDIKAAHQVLTAVLPSLGNLCMVC